MEDRDGIIYLVFNLFEDSRTLNNNLYERNKNKLLANLLIMRFNQMLAKSVKMFLQKQSLFTGLSKTWTVFTWSFYSKPKFGMKTSSRNFTKLIVALQNVYSSEHLQMAASSIAIIHTGSLTKWHFSKYSHRLDIQDPLSGRLLCGCYGNFRCTNKN